MLLSSNHWMSSPKAISGLQDAQVRVVRVRAKPYTCGMECYPNSSGISCEKTCPTSPNTVQIELQTDSVALFVWLEVEGTVGSVLYKH